MEGEIGIDLSRVAGRLDEIAIDGRYEIGVLKVDEASDGDLFNNGFSGRLSIRFRL